MLLLPVMWFVVSVFLSIDDRALHHVIERDTAQRPSEFPFCNWENWHYDFGDDLRIGLCAGFMDIGDAQNILCRHAAILARKFIAATRATDAFEDAGVHQ